MSTYLYPKRALETWRTSRLGGLYISCFTLSERDSRELHKLGRVTDVLSRRDMDELKPIYFHLSEQVALSVRKGDFETANLFKRMREHFHKFVYN